MKSLMDSIFDTFNNEIHTTRNSSLFGGPIPRDTGLVQNTIREVLRINGAHDGEGTALFKIGATEQQRGTPYYAVYLEYADLVGASTKPNRHKGFLEKFVKTSFAEALGKYGTVRVE